MSAIHLTVAAIIERDGNYVLVTDRTSQGLKLNQPAGHIEAQEDPIAAVIREVKEETSLDFIPQAITGIYFYYPNPHTTYLRICFKGQLVDATLMPQPAIHDDDVVRAEWLSLSEIKARHAEHRSSLVWQSISDYLAGNSYPLTLLSSLRETINLD